MATLPLPPSPFPGLRPFRPQEALIFCGRAESHAEVLDLLGRSRFLAIVGASGSGKSSLVLAGLLPDIRDGLLIGVDPDAVRITTLQPGLRPFANLAAALKKEFQTDLEIEPVLRRGPLGVAQLLDQLAVPAEAALVIVVDQFEELFRFAGFTDEELMRQERGRAGTPLLDGTHNEAQAFVSLLLETATQTQHQVYVILTMRSDYIGRCDEFNGLPGAISHSQFLTPRLNRQQLEQAIVRPLDHYGATIQPELVNLILNQVSPEQDQLPLLQHALARTWQRAKARTPPPDAVTLTIEDYKRVGGLAEALNLHAEDVCAQLAASPLAIGEGSIERFFRALGHHDIAGQAPVRRPVRVKRMAEETGLDPAVVRAIADAFRAEGCHLLVPPPTRVPELQDDTVLDIGHETLLRQWAKLKAWMAVEWRERQTLESLATAMATWEREAPPANGDIVLRFDRFKQAGETVATSVYRDASRTLFSKTAPRPWLPFWVDRYQINWPRLDRYCREAFLWKRVTSVLSTAGFGLVILSGLLLGMTVFAFVQMRAANVQKTKATEAAKFASDQATLAKRALAAEQASRQNLVVETSRVKQAQADAVNQLVNAQNDARFQNASLAINLQAVLKDDKNSPTLQKLVARLRDNGVAPEIFTQLPSAEAPTATPPLPPNPSRVAPDILGAPALLKLPSKAPPSALAFLKTQSGLLVLSGAEGDAHTRCWTLNGAPADAGAFPFETTTFIPAPDAHAVVAVSFDAELHLITGSQTATATKVDGNDAVICGKWVDTPSQPLVLFGTDKANVGVWDTVANSKPRLFPSGGQGVVNGVDFAPGTNALLASGDDHWAKLWSTPQGLTGLLAGNASLLFNRTGGAPIRRASFSPDGRSVLLPLGSPNLELQSVIGNAPTTSLAHKEGVWFARFSPDGRIIASADTTNQVYLWDVEALRRKGSMRTDPPTPVILQGHRAAIITLQWSPDGSYFITSDKEGLTLLWQHPLERLQGRFNDVPLLLPSHPGGVRGTAIDPSGRFVATAGQDGVARVYPLRPTLRGKFREWSRPSGGGSDLALFSDADAALASFAGFFLRDQPPGTAGLAYRLNPDALFVNARWDYSFTSRSMLRGAKVKLRRLGPDGNTVGPGVDAQPVDWGPPADTGKDFDVSPGLRRKLGLQDGDLVELEWSMIPPLSEKGVAAD